MKKYILAIGLLVLLACAPPHQEAESTVSITAPDGYAVTCVTGFTRLVPHLCGVSPNTGVQVATVDGTCRSIDWVSVLGVPITTKYITLHENVTIQSGNAISSLRGVAILYYVDSSCTNTTTSANTVTREEVLVAAGTALLEVNNFRQAASTAGVMYYKATNASAATVLLNFRLISYYD